MAARSAAGLSGVEAVPFGHSGTPPGTTDCSFGLWRGLMPQLIGAGPAGSTATYRLARARARVLHRDKARFPRDKPCGGGLTMRAVRQLPFSVEPVVEDRITRTRCRLRYGPKIEHESPRVVCLMTQRRRLDAFLVGQAVAAGVEFRDGVHVAVDSETELRVDGRPVEVRAVIGADG